MNSDTISGLTIGVLIGTAVALTGGYFVGTIVLRKTLRDIDNEQQSSANDRNQHLRRAQEILDTPTNSNSQSDSD